MGINKYKYQLETQSNISICVKNQEHIFSLMGHIGKHGNLALVVPVAAAAAADIIYIYIIW